MAYSSLFTMSLAELNSERLKTTGLTFNGSRPANPINTALTVVKFDCEFSSISGITIRVAQTNHSAPSTKTYIDSTLKSTLAGAGGYATIDCSAITGIKTLEVTFEGTNVGDILNEYYIFAWE